MPFVRITFGEIEVKSVCCFELDIVVLYMKCHTRLSHLAPPLASSLCLSSVSLSASVIAMFVVSAIISLPQFHPFHGVFPSPFHKLRVAL